uniref:Basonuclin 2 n=2 Tax=Nothobranchius pienaari TaxID=704102 RepID=A0A1A8LPR1_9TELE
MQFSTRPPSAEQPGFMGTWQQQSTDSNLLYRMSQQAIRCTLVNCTCECFQPGKIHLRTCDQCKHGWVAHALDKLSTQHLYHPTQVEIVQSNVVFDISSLMLKLSSSSSSRHSSSNNSSRVNSNLRRPIKIKEELSDPTYDMFCMSQYGLYNGGMAAAAAAAASMAALHESFISSIGYGASPPNSNINLHRKLLTKELDDIVLDPQLTPLPKDLRAEFLAKIYTGHHMGLDPMTRMGIGGASLGPPGLNFSARSLMSNDYPHHPFNQDLKNHHINSLFRRQPDDYVVLDLSTTSSVQSSSSIHSSHESEEGSDEGILLDDLEEEGEEDEEEGNSDGEDYSQRFRGPAEGGLPDEAGELKDGEDEGLDSSSSPFLLSSTGGSNGSSSGILCNICHKIYSNKGTLRVHYKTVHLREMHKCKIPGCNMVFSSVRSRNRHSQNPNLHKNTPFSTILD